MYIQETSPGSEVKHTRAQATNRSTAANAATTANAATAATTSDAANPAHGPDLLRSQTDCGRP
ncbi:hypothetical protein CPter91_2360 [Collimonas pratensis]|uniref:Uncharacterized protein n=1 Tax=Collimonas pratensis TaxID=279113 RepID=A0A127Q505_9BURK|nr:hypothetical protein CPter91_2360 [Collimonas pratensis]